MPTRFFQKSVVLLLVAFSCHLASSNVENNLVEKECDLPASLVEEIKNYEGVANTIINSLTNGKFKGATYRELATFIDKFGARVSGTQNLENAIDYMLDIMKENGLENVHGEEVQVPHWVREFESGQLVEPRQTNLPVLGLGSSIGTAKEGLEAEAIVVRSFDELKMENFSKAAKGKIVVYNEDWVSYGETVQYRSHGAAEAAKLGAVATLIRSVTAFSMETLHTGSQDYEDSPKIPTASITVEDAKMLQRMQDRGEKIVIKLNLNYTQYPDSTSRNSVGELQGSKLPEKVVLVSGHLDSWDVGTGAMDDGGGAFISWYSLVVLKALGLRAKRTLRAVLWTAEEEGLVGFFAYNDTHFHELDNFTFVMESDEGTFTPLGLEYAAGNKGGCIIKEIVKLLSPINATQAVQNNAGVGSDISPWTASLLPGAALLNANQRYTWFHHSPADRMEVLDPDALDKATAVWAVVSYIIADLKEEFPRSREDATSASDAKIRSVLKTRNKN